jgi:hypothetical protein
MPVVFSVLFLSFTGVSAETVSFSGQLGSVDVDTGGGVYSGVPLGTDFNGSIDDDSATGTITDGVTMTDFGCCIAAGGLSVDNNVTLKADDASLINSLLGSPVYSAGDVIDFVEVEGDAITAGGGRIEVGLSFVFDKNTFKNGKASNYPFNPDDAILGVFFIFEEDSVGTEIYSAVGVLDQFAFPEVWFDHDNFNTKTYNGCKYCINPDKWIGLQRNGSSYTEILREIKAKRLHLAQRNWGDSDSDVGTQQGRNRVRFRNSVNFSGVCFTPRIKKYEVNDCGANGSAGQVRMRYVGTFYDAVDGGDDGEVGTVYGWFDLIRSADSGDKKGIFRVQAYADECQDVNCQIDNWSTYDGVDDPDLFFGTVKASKNKKSMCIEYDRVNHKLEFSYGNDTRVVNAADHGLPAFATDMTANNDWHVIESRVDVENCSAGKVTGFVDGDVDDVRIKRYR